MPKQREREHASVSRAPDIAPARAAIAIRPPRYGMDFVDFAARPDGRWVSGARAGRFPFGDRLAHESGGAVDPHAVPSVVRSDLPDRGVSVEGKVGLRPDAPIEVARHELAHSLGADEALAHRAERDLGVLGGLSMHAPPIDGWAVGFEFQTSGPKNPKTYSRGTQRHPGLPQESVSAYIARTRNLPPNYTQWQQDINIDTHDRDGYKIKSDDKDMDVETDPVPETAAGRVRLAQIMATMTAEMADISANALNQGDPPTNVYTIDDQRLKGIAHQNANFTGKPQATVGIKLDQVSNLITKLTKEHRRYGWGDYWAAKNPRLPKDKPGLAKINDLNQRTNALQSVSPNVASLLHLIASYSVYGDALRLPTKYLKNIGNPVMSRNNLGKIFSDYLSENEQQELRNLLTQTAGKRKIAQLFGIQNFDSLAEKKILKHGLTNDYHGAHVTNELADLTVQKVFDDLLEGVDAIHEATPDASIGKIADDDTKFPSQANPFDIGESATEDERRGILVELRALDDREPYTRWSTLALLIFDLTTKLNQGRTFAQPMQQAQPLQQAVPQQQQQQPPPQVVPQQQQQQPRPRVRQVVADRARVNEVVDFTDGHGKQARAKVIKVHDADHVRVNHNHKVVELQWANGAWAAAG